MRDYPYLFRALVACSISACVTSSYGGDFASASITHSKARAKPIEQPRELRVISGPHQIDGYAVELLNRIIDNERYRLSIIPMGVTQKRALEQMDRKRSDIFWAPTTIALEERLQAVYFPVFKGLLGYRIFLIPSGTQQKFSVIENIEQARDLIYGQMSSWTDTRILIHNQFKVLTTPTYHSLFPMLAKQRFDAVPRGIFEPWNELASHRELGLAVEQELAFSYTLPFYFFVRKDEKELANMLYDGLNAYLNSGEFDQYLFEHDLVRHNLERANLHNRRIFYLQNPELSEQTPLDKDHYWYRVNTH